MIPLYWINLENSIDRRNRILSECRNYGITNRRVDAICHEKPHIGCCLSHIKAIHTAFIDGNDLAIICEDDIQVDNEMFQRVGCVLDSLLDHVKTTWDILQLSYIEPTFQECIVDHIQTTSVKNDQLGNIIIKGYFMGCASYLINRRGMLKFLQTMTRQDPVDMAKYEVTALLDNPLAKAEELIYRYVNTYVPMYPVINYIGGDSTINTEKKYIDNNSKNSDLTKKILDTLILKNYSIIGSYELEYNCHWFNGIKREAYKCLHSML